EADADSEQDDGDRPAEVDGRELQPRGARGALPAEEERDADPDEDEDADGCRDTVPDVDERPVLRDQEGAVGTGLAARARPPLEERRDEADRQGDRVDGRDQRPLEARLEPAAR